MDQVRSNKTKPHDEAAASLKPAYCPYCAYPLEGLPEFGRCPECGEGYLEDEIVIFGWPSGMEMINAKWIKSSWMAFIVPLLYLAGIMANLISGGLDLASGLFGSAMLLGIYSFFAVGPLLLFWYWSRRIPKGVRTLTQVRLYPHGYGGRFGYGGVRLREWQRECDFEMSPQSNGMYHLSITPIKPDSELMTGERVSITFECDEKRADVIRKSVTGWRDTARSVHQYWR